MNTKNCKLKQDKMGALSIDNDRNHPEEKSTTKTQKIGNNASSEEETDTSNEKKNNGTLLKHKYPNQNNKKLKIIKKEGHLYSLNNKVSPLLSDVNSKTGQKSFRYTISHNTNQNININTQNSLGKTKIAKVTKIEENNDGNFHDTNFRSLDNNNNNIYKLMYPQNNSNLDNNNYNYGEMFIQNEPQSDIINTNNELIINDEYNNQKSNYQMENINIENNQHISERRNSSQELNNINNILNSPGIPNNEKIDLLNGYLKQLTNNHSANQNINSKDNLGIDNILNNPKGEQEFNYLNNPALINNLFNISPQKRAKKKNNIIKEFGALTRAGTDENGEQKINQDAYICETNVNNIKEFNMFGVLDGHGPQGHFVSELASHLIPTQIMNQPEIKLNTDIEIIYNNLKDNDFDIIKQAFIYANDKLEIDNFDVNESGTTCVLIIQIGTHLICANVGDSRAIIAFDEENDNDLNFLRTLPLSIDYKPEIPEEKARILMAGGVVDKIKDNTGLGVGPYRVFAPGKDYPGLAMSRSIGDLIGKKLGVIAEPGISEYIIDKNTKFVILCSDGVWEFLDNEMVKNVGKQFYLNSNAKELCQELISRSVIEWKTNDEITDDITAVVAFF